MKKFSDPRPRPVGRHPTTVLVHFRDDHLRAAPMQTR